MLCLSEDISPFKSRITGVILMLVPCVILHTMWLGKSLQCLCILPFSIVCLSTIRMMVVRKLLAVCMFLGMVNFVQSAFL